MSDIRNKKLKVGITLGDTNGIGPELVLHAFQDNRLKEICIPILYGSSRVINIYRKVLDMNKFHYIIIQKPSQAQYKKLNIIECAPDLERVDIGKASEEGGKAAYMALKRAIEDAQHGTIDVMVTLPVDKSTFKDGSGEDFSGHTELLAKAFGVDENLMMMVSDEMKVGLVTNHLAIQDVSRNITANRILNKINIMHRTFHEDFNIPKPQIAVLGLNPHAGDNGLIGSEEQEIINEAIQKARKNGIRVTGPYPPDGFFGALTYRKFDGIIAMYHDQGLIPFKLVAGLTGVNYTAGMPFIRTSPDHGVAYDLAGTGKADAESFRRSVYLAIDVFRNRQENKALQADALKPSSKHMKHQEIDHNA